MTIIKDKVKKLETPLGRQNGTKLWKTMWRSLTKLKIELPKNKNKKELPYDLAILLLGIYPKEVKSRSQKDFNTLMLIAAQ
jgi:hypothetical protein